MDVGVLDVGLAASAEEVFHTLPNLVAMVEIGPCDDRGVDGEEEEVYTDVARREEGRRVAFVFGGVENAAVVDGAADVIVVAEMVEDARRVDGQVARVVDVCVPEAEDDEAAYHEANEGVPPEEEGQHEGGTAFVKGQDVPVEGGDRVEAHSVLHAADGREVHVVGGDPHHPAEDAECLEKEVW